MPSKSLPQQNAWTSEFAVLGYNDGELVAIDLDGDSGFSREWEERGYKVARLSHDDALVMWHTTLKTGNRRWDRNAA